MPIQSDSLICDRQLLIIFSQAGGLGLRQLPASGSSSAESKYCSTCCLHFNIPVFKAARGNAGRGAGWGEGTAALEKMVGWKQSQWPWFVQSKTSLMGFPVETASPWGGKQWPPSAAPPSHGKGVTLGTAANFPPAGWDESPVQSPSVWEDNCAREWPHERGHANRWVQEALF